MYILSGNFACKIKKATLPPPPTCCRAIFFSPKQSMVLPSIECEKWCRTNHGQKDKLPAASHLLYSTLVCLGQGIGRSTQGIRFNWRTVWMVKRKEREYGKRLNLGSGSGYFGNPPISFIPGKYSLHPLGSCPN